MHNGARDDIVVQTNGRRLQVGAASAVQEPWWRKAKFIWCEVTEHEDSRGGGGGGVKQSSV